MGNKDEKVIILASDHGGYKLKEYLKSKLDKENYKIKDFGTFSEKSVDYPDIIYKAAKEVAKKEKKGYVGVFICGTGIGASIAANKVKNIRAALVYEKALAYLSRTHNNANVIVFGGRFIKFRKAYKLLKIWLNTPFSNEERHIRRIKKLKMIEKNESKI